MPELAAAGGSPKTTRGRETRGRILEAALELFEERGFAETTMRAVAGRAEVALGAAYYYFPSKEHLVHGFYWRTHAEHLAVCRERLGAERSFQARLALVLRTKVETSMPYHRFAGVLFRTAADPNSPLSPFSPESAPLRREVTDLYADVVAGSDLAPARGLGAHLPNLLWLYQMGVLLFWVHDDSPRCARTLRLIEDTSKVVARLTRLSRLPIVRPLVRETVELMAGLEPLGD